MAFTAKIKFILRAHITFPLLGISFPEEVPLWMLDEIIAWQLKIYCFFSNLSLQRQRECANFLPFILT